LDAIMALKVLRCEVSIFVVVFIEGTDGQRRARSSGGLLLEAFGGAGCNPFVDVGVRGADSTLGFDLTKDFTQSLEPVLLGVAGDILHMIHVTDAPLNTRQRNRAGSQKCTRTHLAAIDEHRLPLHPHLAPKCLKLMLRFQSSQQHKFTLAILDLGFAMSVVS
jgi:hypothetical protein